MDKINLVLIGFIVRNLTTSGSSEVIILNLQCQLHFSTVAYKQLKPVNNGKLKQPEYAKKLLNLIIKDQALDYYIDQAKNYFMKQGNPPQWYYPV